jgi:hypothetical protein
VNFTELLRLVYLSVACGAISMVITKGAIFDGFHEWLEKRSPFSEKLLSCPWCTSHWVAFILVLVYRPVVMTAFLPIDYLVSVMVMVALSSITTKLIHWAYSSPAE